MIDVNLLHSQLQFDSFRFSINQFSPSAVDRTLEESKELDLQFNRMLNNRAHVSYPGDLHIRNSSSASSSSSHSEALSDMHRSSEGQRDRQGHGQDGYEDGGEDERFQHGDDSQHIEVHLTSNQWNGTCMPVLTT